MFSAPKIKPVLLSPKAEPSRNFHSTFSPKLNPVSTNPPEGFAYHKDLIKQSSPTNRDSTKVSHFIPKGAHSPIHYKNKRPVEIADLGESDRLGLSASIPASHETRPSAPYDLGNSQDTRTPFLSTRGEGGLDMEIESSNISYRTVGSSQKGNNNSSTSYLAEKVYAMKMKGPGLMGSLMPLSKSKSPITSTKNGITTPNKSGFRETDSYQSNTRSGIGYQGDGGDSSSSGLYKRSGEGYKSAGKNVNERKAINTNAIHDNQMKRDNSWGKIKKPQTPVPRSEKKGPVSGEKGKGNGIGAYSSPNREKNSGQGMLKAKLEVLVTRISAILWQANQRNKRSTFVTLVDKWKQSEYKLAKYLSRKGTVLKSKYFCLWQEFLLEVNLERQRIQQEKAEEMKIALADMFHDRKLLRKSFRLLRMADEILPKTLSKNSGIHPKSAKSLRHPSISLQKSPINPSRATPVSSSAIKGHTPQSKSKATVSKPNSISEKKTQKPVTKPATTSKVQSPVENRSKSVGKVLKDVRPSTANQRNNANNVDKLNNSVNMESPSRKESSVNYSRYSKYPIRFYEPSEIEEATEMSQSPNKPNKEGKDVEDVGVGDTGQSFEKGKEAFDFILAEILHTSDSPRSPKAERISIKTSKLEIEEVTAENSKGAPKSATLKGTPKKSDFMLKLDAVPKSVRGYSSPGKSERNSAREYSLTTRRNSKYEDNKFVRGSNKKTVESLVTPPKRIVSARMKTENTEEDAEVDPMERVNLEKALKYRRNRLLQIPFVWLMAAAQQTKEELEEQTIRAEIHYENSLKIKALSGLLQNFVQCFKENYENNQQRQETAKSEGSESDETYNEIVDRFRFIVLTEKAIRQWKNVVASNKKPVVQKYRK